MLPNRIKKTGLIDFYTKLENYVLNNYTSGLINESVENFFRDIKQNRDVICKLSKNETNEEQLMQHKIILTTYLNEILTLKSKMTFGKQSYSCKIGFIWTDTISNKEWKSYNIYFEIYNCMFNLASIYFSLGQSISKNAKDDKNQSKEAIKYFKHALYLLRYKLHSLIYQI